MTDSPQEDVDALIQNYQQTNKQLRGRAIILAVLFIIILGLLHSTHENDRRRVAYVKTIIHLSDLTKTDSLARSLDSIHDEMAWEWDIIHYNVFTQEQFDKLQFDLQKSHYQDKTPLYELIADYDKQMKTLGLKTDDYQISVLGFSTSMSDWIYFSPIILLLLYHDLTVKILYRRSLREKLRTSGIESWKLGSEIFGVEHEPAETPANRFVRLMTTLFTIVLLFLPIIPVFIGAIFYAQEKSDTDTRFFMVVIQWVSPVIMTIEMLVIYYAENLMWAKNIGDWLKKRLTKPPRKLTFFSSSCYGALLLFLLGLISHDFQDNPHFEFDFLLTVLISVLVLPIAEFLLYRLPNNNWLKGARIMGRVLDFFWSLMVFMFFFIFPPTRLHYPKEFWMGCAWILIISSIPIIGVYVWVFLKKENDTQKIEEGK